MPAIDDFRSELIAQLDRAQKQGRLHAEINAGELHRTLGGYPSRSHSMPMCCKAMREEYATGNADIVSEPDSGQGASLTIRYGLPRPLVQD